ncbi:type I-E CRISPR-associated protein Cse2/CasB [Methanosphaerula subterraneus]|uniref:type I-E CRISPR-associated protein Cse2/CasB n=1 Tax=Methanosphaerula subterraneus TaxID=3350244 RepID=UPI003F862125
MTRDGHDMMQRKTRGFSDSDVNEYLIDWIDRLNEHMEDSDRRFTRTDRALLRRCRTCTEVGMLPTFHRFRQDLERLDPGFGNDRERLALIAGVLAHLDRGDDLVNCSTRMASPKEVGGDRPRLHDLRFRRLMAITQPILLYAPLVRAIRELEREGNAPDLAYSIANWNDQIKIGWAYDYYANIPEKKQE